MKEYIFKDLVRLPFINSEQNKHKMDPNIHKFKKTSGEKRSRTGICSLWL